MVPSAPAEVIYRPVSMAHLASLVRTCLIVAKTVVAESPSAAEETGVASPLNCNASLRRPRTAVSFGTQTSHAFCGGVVTRCLWLKRV